MDNTAGNNMPFSSDRSAKSDTPLQKAASGAHGAVESIARKINEAADNAKPTIERVAAKAHVAVDKAAGAAAPAAEWIAAKAKNLDETQRKLVDDTCHFVAEHPIKSIVIAFGAGVLISRLLR